MSETTPTTITIETTVNAERARVWELYTRPEHITQWNFASPEWHCPAATNDLEPGGAFSWRMEARDGSMGFDFSGSYDEVNPHARIASHLDDDRKVVISFTETEDGVRTRISQAFEIEDQHSAEQQRAGWQAILDNFKAYAERN